MISVSSTHSENIVDEQTRLKQNRKKKVNPTIRPLYLQNSIVFTQTHTFIKIFT